MNYDKGNNKEVSVLYNNAAHPKWNILLNNFKWINSLTCEWVWRLITPNLSSEKTESLCAIFHLKTIVEASSILLVNLKSLLSSSHFLCHVVKSLCENDSFHSSKVKREIHHFNGGCSKVHHSLLFKVNPRAKRLFESCFYFQCKRKLTFITNLLIETEAY